MKSKKKRGLICGIALVSIVAIVLAIVYTSKQDKAGEPSGEEGAGVSVPIETEDLQEDPETAGMQALIDSNEKIHDNGTALQAAVESEPEYQAPVKGTGNDTQKPAEKNPIPKEEGTSGVVIGSEENADRYDCKTKNHHCDGPETHAFILNLESEGCPTCGSHSCPSFYATDPWGHTCYTPGKCPKYNAHNDPAEYCQKCGKKCGDGGNGTCVQYITACNCPGCGKWVESLTCHSH